MNKKVKKFLNKKNRAKVICLTAYSKNVASILDKHCDLVLVGDSLGSVLYNYKSTKEVTLKTMINHSKSVRLGVKKRSIYQINIRFHQLNLLKVPPLSSKVYHLFPKYSHKSLVNHYRIEIELAGYIYFQNL